MTKKLILANEAGKYYTGNIAPAFAFSKKLVNARFFGSMEEIEKHMNEVKERLGDNFDKHFWMFEVRTVIWN